MNEEELRIWLNEVNRQLLEEIEKEIPVRFTLWDRDYHACQVHKDGNNNPHDVEIFYRDETSQAKITHELLHAKISVVLGDGMSLSDVANMTPAYEGLLTPDNVDNIINACEHLILYPDYIDMGYREEDSFVEYELSVEARQRMTFLCNHGLRLGGRYDLNRVYDYLKLGFSIYFYPNEERFQEEVNALRRLDRGLFSKLRILHDACTDLDIVPGNREYISNAYRRFGTELNHWFRVNRV